MVGRLESTKRSGPRTWTEASVFKVPPGLHADRGPERVSGLYLRVTEHGGRYFLLRYSIDGRRRDMGLGSLSDITLDEARVLARQARRIRREGEDPLDRRAHVQATQRQNEAHAGWKFSDAAAAVLETMRPSWKNRKHADQWINTLKTYAYPVIKDKPVGEIEVGDIVAILKPIWQDKAETARRIRQRLDQVMRWAEAHGHTVRNPVPAASELLPKQRAKVQHHAAMPYGDVPALMTRLTARAPASGALALTFAILTAGRSGEVRGAVWSEIQGKTWVIPADRMKADREHRVPLSTQALNTLREAKRQFGDDGFIFPGARAGKPLSDMTLTAALRRLKVEATAHGFRSSFRDWCAETGVNRELAERCLAHSVKDSTEAAYHRTDQLKQRQPVMQAWADFIC